MSSADLVIRNGWVVTHDHREFGGVAVEGDQIIYVGPNSGLPAAHRIIDAHEQFIIPGLIDPHVHMSSEEDASIAEGMRANLPIESRGMLHGGVTTFGHFVGAAGQPLLSMLKANIDSLNRHSYVDSMLHAYVMGEETLGDFESAWRLGVTSFKHFYTAYGRRRLEDPGLGHLFSPVDNDVLLQSMQWIAAKGGPGVAMVHAEDGEIVKLLSGQVESTGRRDLGAWSDGRPGIAEWLRVYQAIQLSDWSRCPLYVVHMTTAESCRLVAEARRRGSPIWSEVGPQWLTHHGGMEDKVGCWGKVNPPLRTFTDIDALWHGFHSNGVTCLGTDHGTGGRTTQTKEKGGGKHGNIWAARPGIRGGSEHMLPVLLTYGVLPGRISWEDLVRCGSYNTARAFGLYPRKGGLWPGADADILIVNPEIERTVNETFYKGLCEVSIYDGERLKGAVQAAVLRGRVALEEFQEATEPGWGRYVPRGSSFAHKPTV